jgi:FkbM family methyltransferase
MSDAQNEKIKDLERKAEVQKLRIKRQRKVGYAHGLLDGVLTMLGPDDTIVDCGANIGEITTKMAATGAKVFAFEPDPWSFERLERNTKEFANVTRFQAAVGAQAGTLNLFRPAEFEDRPRRASTASSLVPGMRDVDESTDGIPVEVVGFADWIETKLGEGHKIRLIKVDIEGAELDLMESLMDRGLPDRVGLMLVETHQRQLPAEAERFAALRDRVKDFRAGCINLDWI